MARTINQEARVRTHGDPVVTFVRARIPLSRSLPPTFEDALKAPREPKDDVDIKNEEGEQGDDVTVRRNERVDRLLKRCDWNGWDNLVHALGKSRGCRHISCGRIAEDPELVLFVIGRFPPSLSPLFFFSFFLDFFLLFPPTLFSLIRTMHLVWWDATCASEFFSSPRYNIVLTALSSPDSGSTPTAQTIKFSGRTASNLTYLKDWLSIFTITVPFPATDAQREMFGTLRGPQYPRDHAGMDPALRAALIRLPAPSRAPDVQHGWAVAPRSIADDETQVQDAVLYRKWTNKELEEEWRAGAAGLKPDWQQELSEFGEAVELKEEHVELFVVVAFEGTS